MADYHLHVDQKCSVHEMRQHLARILCHLDGDQEVTFSFTARILEYKPAAESKRHNTMPAVLGAPYDMSQPDDPHRDLAQGLWGYAASYADRVNEGTADHGFYATTDADVRRMLFLAQLKDAGCTPPAAFGDPDAPLPKVHFVFRLGVNPKRVVFGPLADPKNS